MAAEIYALITEKVGFDERVVKLEHITLVIW